MSVITVIHDNPDWIPPLQAGFDAEGASFQEWLLPGTVLDLSSEPPEGVYWSRLSASSHTRTDPHVKEYGRAVLAWLEAAGRTVINGARVYELEVSKIRQHRELAAQGFDVPKTVATFGARALAEAAKSFASPFISKHNQGGKGLGVRRFDSHGEFNASLHEFGSNGSNAPIDGITLVQEYVEPREPFITRAEFIGGEFHYAVRVDVSDGSFELCPAEACEVPQPGIAAVVCDVNDRDTPVQETQFRLRPEITAETPLIQRLSAWLQRLNIDIAGIEFIETSDGRQVVYDINTNTNYNPDVEREISERDGIPATRRIAQYLTSVA